MLALLAALAVASGLILIYGQSPAQVYAMMLAHTWGDAYGLGQVIFRATPLIFTGLAVQVAFHAGLFNIGGEGQLLVGSFAAGVAGAALPAGMPAPFAILLCLAAAALAGGLLGALPGALKARFGAHGEVINMIDHAQLHRAGATVLWAGRRVFFVAESVHTPLVVAAARLPGLAFLFGEGTSASKRNT